MDRCQTVQQVGLPADLHRLTGQPLRLCVLFATAREHPRLHLPPEHLRDGVVGRAEFSRAGRTTLPLRRLSGKRARRALVGATRDSYRAGA